jgi:two-component system nitrogen regulation sensor histidine kinase NtrY
MRTAESLAERVAEEAGAWYFEVDGAVDLLANRVGSDLLLYQGGELVGGSLPELVELGLYEGWIPVPVEQVMSGGEAVTTSATASLGGWEYVVAYRRMPGNQVLAAPAPLQAGATALGQRDVTDLIAFSVVFGGLLSVLLALAAGRALARPIQTLSIASERVGAGNMAVRLPEGRRDEFGTVFDAFNRMVDRLAGARKALVSESRRTRAIVEEVPIGVVALDPRGRVSLASSRVERLLGTSLATGQVIPRGVGTDDPRTALSEWVAGYFRDELSEAGTELSFGDRRIRVRARRISRKGPLGGAVLTLEDVTDELRTERILAWGEMAQQVAHEVKNPLTPIKLGIQHIRRAWADHQPEYEEILNHNVEVILEEIDRLAAVASSFSEYGAPSPAGLRPLERVDVLEVAKEVLDLYAAGMGATRFRLEGEGTAPPVRAREDELKEVLVNLLENARAAVHEDGDVLVKVRPADHDVEIAISDNGIGIAPELLPRIFEPHFSTRSGGTGLGLAIVRRLVESWGGSVLAESVPGRGTTLRIRVPQWRGDDPPRDR